MSKKFTQEDLNNLIDDATYLQDEAEALKYVIDSVPVTQSPPDDDSIIEKLLLLDHLQVNYYRPVFESVDGSHHRHFKAKNYNQFCNEFSPENIEEINVQKTLNSVAKHRAALVNIISQIPLIDWEQTVYKDNQQISLHYFGRDMVQKDRKLLKEIADQVMAFQQDRNARREVEKNLPQKGQQPPDN